MVRPGRNRSQPRRRRADAGNGARLLPVVVRGVQVLSGATSPSDLCREATAVRAAELDDSERVGCHLLFPWKCVRSASDLRHRCALGQCCLGSSRTFRVRGTPAVSVTPVGQQGRGSVLARRQDGNGIERGAAGPLSRGLRPMPSASRPGRGWTWGLLKESRLLERPDPKPSPTTACRPRTGACRGLLKDVDPSVQRTALSLAATGGRDG